MLPWQARAEQDGVPTSTPFVPWRACSTGASVPGFLPRWQFWAPLVAVLLLVAWRAVDHWWHALPGPAWHTPGPVAAAHSPWEANCAACHTLLTPASATNWLGMSIGMTHAADAQ